MGRGKRRSAGFALTELMVVLVIAGLVLAITAPPAMKLWRRGALDRSGSRLLGALRVCRQKAVWARKPYRLTIDPVRACFYSERRDSVGTWVLDPADTVYADPGIGVAVTAGGTTSNRDIYFEGRGTVRAEDAPATVLFWNDRAETLSVRLVRTGRVRLSRRGGS